MESFFKVVVEQLFSIGGVAAALMFVVWWFERSERVENAKNTNRVLQELATSIKLLLDRTPRSKGNE